MKKTYALLKSYKNNNFVKYSLLFCTLFMIVSIFIPVFWNPFYVINQITISLLLGDLGALIFYLFLFTWILRYFFNISLLSSIYNRIWFQIAIYTIPFVVLCISFPLSSNTSFTSLSGALVYNNSWLNIWLSRFQSSNWLSLNLIFNIQQMGVIYTTLFLISFGSLGALYPILSGSIFFFGSIYISLFGKNLKFNFPFKQNTLPMTENLASLNLDTILTKEFKLDEEKLKSDPTFIDTLDPTNPRDLELLRVIKKIEENKGLTNKVDPELTKRRLSEKERLQNLKDKLAQKNKDINGKVVEEILKNDDEMYELRKKNLLQKGNLSPIYGILEKTNEVKVDLENEIEKQTIESSKESMMTFDDEAFLTIEKALHEDLITIFQTVEQDIFIEDYSSDLYDKTMEVNLALSTSDNIGSAIDKLNIDRKEITEILLSDISDEEPKNEIVEIITSNIDQTEKEIEHDNEIEEIEFQETIVEIETNSPSSIVIEQIDEIKQIEEVNDIKEIKPTPSQVEINQKPERTEKWCKNFSLPKENLLDPQKEFLNKASLMLEANTKSTIINDLFNNFLVKAKVNAFQVGPTITTYEIELDPRTLTNKITSLEDNIKLSLEAKDIRIQAPIPGKSVVGIEVPNNHRKNVTFQEVFLQQKNNEFGEILLTIGQDVVGEVFSFDLTKMPHLLIAGSTGSGKSTAINTIILSILMRYKPQQVSLVLIDPKMVEFVPYHSIPHLITPVITNAPDASLALKAIVVEMEERYKLMASMSARNIIDLNNKLIATGKPKLPYIVIIIDELADLMLVAAKEVEESILRITQKARAAGIHAILATQRPSVNVITGVIKANIPSRIAFSVSSSIDSRTILDRQGAEKLIGMGDMLVSFSGQNPVRGQGAYISDTEIERVTDYVKKQCSPIYLIDLKQAEASLGNLSSILVPENDLSYMEAKRLALQHRKISISMLQRYLGIGYNNAANLIDSLEHYGVIGPAQGGNKPREVISKGE